MMQGILRCTRYAFGPNRLHYCGPDANRELAGYIHEGVTDPGLEKLLKDFKTMFPYLRHIAEANGIRDALDERVVEAYWLGNDLLERTTVPGLFTHLVEGHGIKAKLRPREVAALGVSVERGAVPHHSFHVFDVWRRTGQLERGNLLHSMDECRISWGTVTAADGPSITVSTRSVVLREGKLVLADAAPRKLARKLEVEYDIEQVKPGDMVSIHWGVPCEVITPAQARALEKYTLRHLALANNTI